MTRFAANVGFLFRERPYLERFAAAAASGFAAVEFAWPTVPARYVERAVGDAGLRVALINAPAGDLEAGERGEAHDPALVARWRAGFDEALGMAGAVHCPVVNVLAGNRRDELVTAQQLDCLRDNLDWALSRGARNGVTVVVELLNPIDNPRYLVASIAAAGALLDSLASRGLRLQFDTYHVGQVTADVVSAFRDLAPLVGHVQIADLPGRHEPGSGAIDWPAFFGAVEAADYDGAIGLEYVPAVGTEIGLDWLPRDARSWSPAAWRPRARRPSRGTPD